MGEHWRTKAASPLSPRALMKVMYTTPQTMPSADGLALEGGG